MEEKKVKNLVSLIVTLILVIIILCVTIAYLLYNDNNKKSSNLANQDQVSSDNSASSANSNNNDNDLIVPLNIEDDYIKDMYYNLLYSEDVCNKTSIYHSNNKVSVDDISYSIKMEIATWSWLKEYRKDKKIQSDVQDVNGYDNEFIVPEYRIKEKYTKLFGDNYPKNESDKNTDGCPGTEYSNGKYNVIAGCGGNTGPSNFGFILYKAEKNKNSKELYIYDKIYTIEYNDSYTAGTIYGDFTKTRLIRKNVKDNIIGNETFKNTFTTEEIEKMDTYKFTFKENSDGTYRFVSSEKVK